MTTFKGDITQDALSDYLTGLQKRADVRSPVLDQMALDAMLVEDAAEKPVQLGASPEFFSEKSFWDETMDAETAHDPKSGQFTAGAGAKPSNPTEHQAQASYHGQRAKSHEAGAKKATEKGGYYAARPHHEAVAAHNAAKNWHENAVNHGMGNSKTAHKWSAKAEAASNAAKGTGGYNPQAVQKEISKDPSIKGKEAKAIHSLLKGRH